MVTREVLCLVKSGRFVYSCAVTHIFFCLVGEFVDLCHGRSNACESGV